MKASSLPCPKRRDIGADATSLIQAGDHSWTSGRVLARIDGANCYGQSKQDMILAWLKAESLERDALHIRFYSDHDSDAC